MSSRPLRALALGCTLLLGAACGHKESPKPPPMRIPQPVRDLVVSQRGDELTLRFTHPQTTVSGLPIDDIVAIEVWEYKMPVPEFAAGALDPDSTEETEPTAEPEETPEDEAAAEPTDDAEDIDQNVPEERDDSGDAGAQEEDDEDTGDDEGDGDEDTGDEDDEDEEKQRPSTSKESLLELDPREFVAAASKALVLEGLDLSNAVKGDQVEVSWTLDKIEPGEKEARVYGIKTFQSLKRASAFSNVATIIPRVTPESPSEIEVTGISTGVRLLWTFEGERPEEFRIYRRDPRSSAFGEHHGTQRGSEDRYVDSRAELGSSYVYAVTAVANRNPRVESVLSSEHEIEYLDTFPPEPPSELVVFADVGNARLLWEPGSDDDIAGYFVYRRTEATDWKRLFRKPVRQTEYTDDSASSGRTYFYRVVAVDRRDNLSDPTEEVQVRIP